MKARFYLAMAAAALLMSNCSQEEPMAQSQGGTNTLTATIEGASRSAVTDAGVFSWTAGDAFSVYNGEDFTTFTLSSGNVFTSNETITPSGVAIYPAGSHTYDGTTTKVNLKTEYSYGSTNAPMVAEVTNTTLAFKHVGGLMRFIVKGMPSTATSFTFTANSGITGGFDVSNGVITAATASESNKSVTINFTADQVDTESMTFYIPLPTGTYEGYTVSIGEGQGMSNESATTVKNTIARGTLLLMPTFTYDATNGLSKGTDGGVVTLEGGEQSLAVSGTQAVEVDASGLGDAEAVLNLNYTPEENSTLTLSESGDVTESQEESAATVSVSVPTGTTVATLDITMPSMTVELNAAENETATYTTVNALTAQNTLKIGKGVSVGTLNIKGGHVRLAGSITTSITREGEGTDIIYIILEEGVEAPTVTLPENVKVVNAAEYDLIKAIEEAENGATITLSSDVQLSAPIIITEKELTINLSNHKLTAGLFAESNGTISAGSSDSYVFWVKGGKLTIEGEGEVIAKEATYSMAVWANGGTVVINGGKFTNGGDGCDLIYASGNSSVEINGGEFVATNNTDASEGTQNPYSALNIKDADRTTSTITVKGGKFYQFDPANNVSEGANTNFVSVGWSSTLDGDNYIVSEGIKTEAALLAAIEAGNEVTLSADITLTKPLITTKDLTVSLNNHKLTAGVFAESNGTISEGTSDSYVFWVKGGKLTVEGEGEVIAQKATYSMAVWANGGTVVINGGKFTNGGDGCDLIYASGTSSVEINGGEFVATNNTDASEGTQNPYSALNIKDADRTTSTITVKGGKFYQFDPANNVSEGANTNFVAEGYESTESEEDSVKVYTVSASSTEE